MYETTTSPIWSERSQSSRLVQIQEKPRILNDIEEEEDRPGEALMAERKSSPRPTDSPSFKRPCNINIRETRMQYTARRDWRAGEYYESSGSTILDESRAPRSRKSKFLHTGARIAIIIDYIR